MMAAANVIIKLNAPTSPPRICKKCKGARFEWMEWVNRGGTTEPAYCCRGCGRVYEPVPIDPMDLYRAMARAMRATFANAAKVVTSYSEYIEELKAPPKSHRDPHRRENWRAMEQRHGRRWKGRG